jgi:galactosyl transferase GMA12/MNN10 family
MLLGLLLSPLSLVSCSTLAKQYILDYCTGHNSSPVQLPDEPFERLASYVDAFLDSKQAVYQLRAEVSDYYTAYLEYLGQLLQEDFILAFSCPLLTSKLLLRGGESAFMFDQPRRSLTLLQMGNLFKIQAMSKWFNHITDYGKIKASNAPSQRYETELQAEYGLMLNPLFKAIHNQPVPSNSTDTLPSTSSKMTVGIHSICVYSPDETSNTVLNSPLPEMTPKNHKNYADRYKYEYVMHDRLPLELQHKEAHYSKIKVMRDAVSKNLHHANKWLVYIDCDAFVTNYDVRIEKLIDSVLASRPDTQFIVAEDTGGINTGVFIVKASPWGLNFLDRVSESPYSTAWDQSMFFFESIKDSLFEISGEDFDLPKEITFVHQSMLNSYVQPAAKDWGGWEWRQGDFIKHYAGCPWQEKVCLDAMMNDVNWVKQTWK